MYVHEYGDNHGRYGWGLLGYESNQMEADSIVKEEREGDLVHVEDNTEEVEWSGIYICRIFSDGKEVYDVSPKLISFGKRVWNL